MMTHATAQRLLLTTAMLVMLGGVAHGQQVGTAAAVNPAAAARDVSGATRTVFIGQAIAHKEHIQTTAAGSVQLLFLDKTSMTIGPNSDVSIDEYVFDPQANTGKLAATLAKGAMRFVGGQISHNGDATIKTASAVVGIRGGVSILTTSGVYLGYGQATVSGAGQTVTLDIGDYTGTSPGAAPTQPGEPPANFIATYVKLFQSGAQQSGGSAPGSASQSKVAAAEQKATGGSGNQIAGGPPTTQNTTPPTTSGLFTSIVQSLQTSAPGSFIQTVPPPTPPTTTPTVNTFALNIGNCCSTSGANSAAPFLPAGFAPSGNSAISPMVGLRLPDGRTGVLQFGINVSGTASNQNSWAFLAIGGLTKDASGNTVFTGNFTGTASASPTNFSSLAVGNWGTAPGALTFDNNGLPLSGTMTNSHFSDGSNTVQNNPAFQQTNVPGQSTTPNNYTFQQTLQQTATPAGLGSNRPAANLVGYVGGIGQSFDNQTQSNLAAPYALVGAANVRLSPSDGRVEGDFTVGRTTGTNANTFNSAVYQFGSVNPNQDQRGVYIDYDTFGALSAKQTDGTPISTINGQALQQHEGFMVVVSPAEFAQIANGQAATNGGHQVTACACDFTRWGFWSSHTARIDSNGHLVDDFNNLSTWVAGQLPQISDVPSTGTATYTGHIIGSATDSSGAAPATHIDAGQFANMVDFGRRTGNVTTNFDGVNYAGTVSFTPSDPRFFGGAAAGNAGGRNMTLVGNLFVGSTSPVGEMGGNFTILGRQYIASGIFAAAIPH